MVSEPRTQASTQNVTLTSGPARLPTTGVRRPEAVADATRLAIRDP